MRDIDGCSSSLGLTGAGGRRKEDDGRSRVGKGGRGRRSLSGRGGRSRLRSPCFLGRRLLPRSLLLLLMFLDDVRCGRRRGEPSSREESEKLSCKGRFLGRESRPRRGRGRGRGEVASGSRRVGGGDGSDGHVVGRFVRGEERLLRVVVVRSTTTTWRESRFELVESTLLDRGDSGVELGSDSGEGKTKPENEGSA